MSPLFPRSHPGGFFSSASATVAAVLFLFLALTLIPNDELVGQDAKLTASQVANNWKKAGWEISQGWTPVTDESEARQWGAAIEKEFGAGNMVKAKVMFDFEPMMKRIVVGVTHPGFKRGFPQGVGQSLNKSFEVFASDDVSYAFRGVVQTEFGASAVMRLLDANGACNYHLWRLQKNKLGSIRGIDMYVLGLGESFSNSMRRMALISMPKDDRTAFQKLTGTELELAKHHRILMQLIEARQTGNNQAVLDAYAKLPAKLKSEKSLMIIRMTSAMQVSDEAYVRAMEEYQKAYPGDASAALLGVDLFSMKEQFGKLFAAIDQVESVVGKDGYLEMVRATGYFQQGDVEGARKAAETAVAIEPTLESSYWTLVEISLAQKDFASVSKALKTLVSKFGYSQFDFSENDLFDEFVKSDEKKEFSKWLKSVVRD